MGMFETSVGCAVMDDHAIRPKHVHGGLVVFEDGVQRADVLISPDGLIEAVTAPRTPAATHEEINAEDLLVFPGVIDPHTHLDDPPGGPAEDFISGTRAAAAGGVTTVLDMPQNAPLLVSSLEALQEKRRVVAPKAVIDYAFWGAMTPTNAAEAGDEDLELLVRGGVVALKAFTLDSTQLPGLSDALLLRGLWRAAKLGVVVGLHCENQGLIDFHSRQLELARRDDPFVSSDRRPPIAELEAVRRVLVAAEETGARVHISHASHPAVFDAVLAARLRGAQVSAETCSHYLTLTRDVIASVGSRAVCNPPLRDRDAVEGLWSHLGRGAIDFVGSDHCAYSPQEKAWQDNWTTAPGINGIQVMFPAVVGEAISRGIPMHLMASLFSGNAARLFGLYPQKGALLPGSDADLTLVDPRGAWSVIRDQLLSKSSETAYLGYRVRTVVRQTIVRGTVVFRDDGGRRGRVLVQPGFGRYVTPRNSLSSQRAGIHQ